MNPDFSDLLSRQLSSSQLRLIRAVAQQAEHHGCALYAVGGLPRDLVLGVPHSDLDLVAEGDAIVLARSLAAVYGGKVIAHPKFGTANWAVRGSALEVADATSDSRSKSGSGPYVDLISARSETYAHPAALPTVKRGGLRDDLARRDFTINTLAVRLDGAGFASLRDDFGGLEDLRRGVLRVLHSRSFEDDPTRMYRAVRYEQRFGFKIADETLALIPGARGLVSRLSGQRIRRELDLILEEEHTASILRRLADLQLLAPIHADLPRDKGSLSRVNLAEDSAAFPVPGWTRRDAGWLLWLMHLPSPRIRAIQARLHFPAGLRQACYCVAELERRLPVVARWRPGKAVLFLDTLPTLAVYAAYRASKPGRGRTILGNYLSHWRLMKPHTTGNDLRRQGLEPGPAYASILKALRGAWVEGQVRNAAQERELLRGLLLRHSTTLRSTQRAAIERRLRI